MGNQSHLEVTVREAEPLYRHIAKRCYHNPAARRGAVMCATVGVVAAVVNFFPSSEVIAETVRQYGFSEGLEDGVYSPINAIISIFKDYTGAKDGTGVISRPADWYYSVGFGIGSLIWAFQIYGIINVLRHSKKAKK